MCLIFCLGRALHDAFLPSFIITLPFSSIKCNKVIESEVQEEHETKTLIYFEVHDEISLDPREVLDA